MRELTIQKNDADQRLDRFLGKAVPLLPASLAQKYIRLKRIKRNGKAAKRSKDITRFTVSFTVTRNVTASTGNRRVYVRLLKPSQEVVARSGSFHYENKSIEYSATKEIEYTGEEQHVTLYIPINEYLSSGNYSAYIFIDGQMIGSGSTTISK